MNTLQLAGSLPRLTEQQLAGMLPSDPDFRAYVAHCMGVESASKQDAEKFIRQKCGVQSRKYLTNDHGAAVLFHGMRRQFLAWKEKSLCV